MICLGDSGGPILTQDVQFRGRLCLRLLFFAYLLSPLSTSVGNLCCCFHSSMTMDSSPHLSPSGKKRAQGTSGTRSASKKRKLSNKWIVEGYHYSDLPMLGYARPSQAFCIDEGNRSPAQNYGAVGDADWDDDFQERRSSDWSIITACGQLSEDLGDSVAGARPPPRETARPRALSPARTSSFPRKHRRSTLSEHQTTPPQNAFAEPNHGRTSPVLSLPPLEKAPILWALPPGDPVLPKDLQPVPYPPVPNVLPPLSPTPQHQHDHGPSLPPISQLIESIHHDRAISPHPAPSRTEA